MDDKEDLDKLSVWKQTLRENVLSSKNRSSKIEIFKKPTYQMLKKSEDKVNDSPMTATMIERFKDEDDLLNST